MLVYFVFSLVFWWSKSFSLKYKVVSYSSLGSSTLFLATSSVTFFATSTTTTSATIPDACYSTITTASTAAALTTFTFINDSAVNDDNDYGC